MPANKPIIRDVTKQVISNVLRTNLPIPRLDMPLDSNLILRHGVGNVTFTRSSTGTFIDTSDGLIKTAAGNAARFESNGLLSEGASTNLLLRSEELENAAWTKNRATVSDDGTTAPDGTLTADELIEDTENGPHNAVGGGTASVGVIHTYSTFAKQAAGSRHIGVNGGGLGGASEIPVFSLTDGTVVTPGTSVVFKAAKTASLINGFFRCSVKLTPSNTTTLANVITDGTGLSNVTYTGDGSSSIHVWGGQSEVLPFPSSYIKTTGASVTRSADNLSVSADNIPAPTDDYTISVEVDILGIDSTKTQTVYSVDGETNRKIEIDTTTGLVKATHGAVTSTSTTALVAGTKTKIVFTVDETNQTLYIDGVQEDQDTKGTVTGTATAISIGNAAGSDELFGHEKNFKIFNRALTQLQVLAL